MHIVAGTGILQVSHNYLIDAGTVVLHVCHSNLRQQECTLLLAHVPCMLAIIISDNRSAHCCWHRYLVC